MKWIQPKFDRPTVNRAGMVLLQMPTSLTELDNSLAVINNWRAAHAYPLQAIKMTLKNRARSADANATIAQRLKRLPSITAKLAREQSMRLTQMQDIGGCRAVVSGISELRIVLEKYQAARSKNPSNRHVLHVTKNYIESPKPDGYRGVHLVFKFRSASPLTRIYNDQKIEIQIRTRLQHAWATAVEIVDAFTNQALKADVKLNIADAGWKRFFILISAAMAEMEDCPVVPGAPENHEARKIELRKLAEQLKVSFLLNSLRAAIQHTGQTMNDAASYLLELNLAEKNVVISAFSAKEVDRGTEAYLQKEKDTQADPNVLVVLVTADSFSQLRTAYPNYYLDATEFLQALERATQ